MLVVVRRFYTKGNSSTCSHSNIKELKTGGFLLRVANEAKHFSQPNKYGNKEANQDATANKFLVV